MKTITLEDKELKLLLKILDEASEYRSDMGCNDPYKDEEKLFTKKERIKMNEKLCPDISEEDNDGTLFNSDYVEFIIDKIKKQTK